jgi:hypothetical protein
VLPCLVPAVARQLEAEGGREEEAEGELSPSLSDQAIVEHYGATAECYALIGFVKCYLIFVSYLRVRSLSIFLNNNGATILVVSSGTVLIVFSIFYY